MKKELPEGKQNNERWLLTYSDLITLLMIFFIVMYSMSNLDAKKYSQFAESFKNNPMAVTVKNQDAIIDTSTNKMNIAPQLAVIKSDIDKLIKDNNMQDYVDTKVSNMGLVLSFKDSILFDSGKANIKSSANTLLLNVALIIRNKDNYIRVEGHTDNVPIHTEEFSSNWQLSAVRAANVVQFLVDSGHINANKVYSVGYGDKKPVANNTTEVGKSKNRRVDLIIMDEKLDKYEN